MMRGFVIITELLKGIPAIEALKRGKLISDRRRLSIEQMKKVRRRKMYAGPRA
jgi:hypothetical protein